MSDTHCQANPPVMPSLSRSFKLRCLEGSDEGVSSSGLLDGGPLPPPVPPPPENNAILLENLPLDPFPSILAITN